MQSARRVQSEEVRGHLHDAHSRVMSIASLQQQLAASSLGDVELRSYFTQLCESLSASMIHDHDRVSIAVTADGSAVHADISVSRSEEHTSELQSLMRISYAVFCLKKKN